MNEAALMLLKTQSCDENEAPLSQQIVLGIMYCLLFFDMTWITYKITCPVGGSIFSVVHLEVT
jgi:hypothetical protein